MKILVLFIFVFFSMVANSGEFGTYIGSVVAKWNEDGRSMTLTEPFAFLDPAGVQWDAPKGAVIDGASIPQIAWSVVGGPFEDKYRASSVIHDVACDAKKRPWAYVHMTFYNGMLASGVPKVKAKIMYAAVYHFGPRWPEKREVKYKSIINVPMTICGNAASGNAVCSTQNESKQIDNIVTIEEPPEVKTLTETDFKKLEKEIESKETSTTPMTLNDIRVFR